VSDEKVTETKTTTTTTTTVTTSNGGAAGKEFAFMLRSLAAVAKGTTELQDAAAKLFEIAKSLDPEGKEAGEHEH
jgi:hypothetical protein